MNTIFSYVNVALIGLSLNSYSIERLSPIQEPEVRSKPIEAVQKMPKVWLGVAGQPVNPSLASQLNIKHGVILELVAEDGSAANFGLKKFDVITKIGDRDIGEMNDLRAAVLAAEIGQVVDVVIVSGGKKVVKKIKLEARPKHLSEYSHEPKRIIPAESTNPKIGQLENLQNLPNGDRHKIEEMMLSQMKQFENYFGQIDESLQAEDRLLKNVQEMRLDLGDLRMKGSSNYSGSFTLMDDQGSIRLMDSDEKGKQVEVKDKRGNTLYAGPYETAADKSTVPADVRARIDALGLDSGKQGAGFHFDFGN